MSDPARNAHDAEVPGARAVRVELGARSYEALTGVGLLRELGARTARLFASGSRPGRAFLAFDGGLPASTVAAATSSLLNAGFEVHSAEVVATEERKSLETLEELLGAMARVRLERREPVIALGGGIVGDVAGFAAGVYRRGVRVVQCPTTLLSMVDASVGGKTGVNLRLSDGSLKKNMAGVFHQPALVLADVSTLDSLPSRMLRAGLAECIKHALLGADWNDPDLLDWTERSLPGVLRGESLVRTELVARNVAIKARVVAADEREDAIDEDGGGGGGRALLNLGHTFAHAIETLPNLSPDGDPSHAPLQHGEAVALGLVAACRCAQSLGVAPASLADRVVRLLGLAGLPTGALGLPPTESIVETMFHDKKVAGGRLRLILPVAPGRCKVVLDPTPGAVRGAIDALRL